MDKVYTYKHEMNDTDESVTGISIEILCLREYCEKFLTFSNV